MTTLHPAAAGLDYFAEIAKHSAALADAAEGNLDAPVEHCPGWTVADLVTHVWEVHWFWGTIAERRLTERPDELAEPERPAADTLLADFRAGALRMIEILRSADQEAQVWTWAQSAQNIGFISRHQVQEAAVHRWDAEHAAGRTCTLDVPASVDSIEEFLTYSVSTAAAPAPQPQPALDGQLVLAATDADASWTISDATVPGTVEFSRGATEGVPTIRASASELLFWLYQRVELPVEAPADTDQAAADQLAARFRALSFTG